MVTWAWKVMVITPPEGSVVAVPFKVEPVKAAVALAAGVMLMAVGLTKPAGSTSWNVALLAALGPALLMTRLKVSVWPATGVALLAALLMLRSALGFTVRVAVMVLELAPTVVLSEPTGTELAPVSIAVTITDTEHAEAGGITVPELTDTEFAPGAAVTVEFTQVVVASGAAELLICEG